MLDKMNLVDFLLFFIAVQYLVTAVMICHASIERRKLRRRMATGLSSRRRSLVSVVDDK